jgi:hypothetical protein
MRLWRSGQVFEATTASGLRPLLAILAAARGVALVVENFSGSGVGRSHLDFSGALESGCVDVPFRAFEFRASFADREVGSGCSRRGCESPWN